MRDDRDGRQSTATGSPGQGEADRSRARPWARRRLNTPHSLEAYLKGQSLPRYMQRMSELEREFAVQRRRLEAAYRALQEACADDADRFGARWRAQASAWRFDRLNELIREHNEWYPVEANLPMDPRTCDYVPIRGASYRRIELGPEWVLEHFPPRPPGRGRSPAVPRLAPREPL